MAQLNDSSKSTIISVLIVVMLALIILLCTNSKLDLNAGIIYNGHTLYIIILKL